MDILHQTEAFEKRWDVFLHRQVEMNRRCVPKIRISAFQPGMQVQDSRFAVSHVDMQKRILKVVKRLCNELQLPI